MCFLVNVTKIQNGNTATLFRAIHVFFPDTVVRIKSIFPNILRYTLPESRILFSIDFYNSHSKNLKFFPKICIFKWKL